MTRANAQRCDCASAPVVRGRDTGGHFDLMPQPEREFAPDELSRHEHVYLRYRQNYAE